MNRKNYQKGYHINPPQPKYYPFDLNLVDSHEIFSQMNPGYNKFYSELQAAIEKRDNEIIKAVNENNLLNQLTFCTDRIMMILNQIKNQPPNFMFPSIADVILVGSLVNGTLCAEKLNSDLVVILNYYPKGNVIQGFMIHVCETFLHLIKNEPSLCGNNFKCLQIDNGFAFVGNITINFRFSVRSENIFQIKDLNVRHEMIAILASIRHAKFNKTCANSSVKTISRLLRDIASKNERMAIMNPWMIDLVSYYVVFHNIRSQQLPLPQAFMRVFELLSAGLFTTNSIGILDPCENYAYSVHAQMTLSEQEILMEEAQVLLMKLTRENFDEVFNNKKETEEMTTKEAFDYEEIIRNEFGMKFDYNNNDIKENPQQFFNDSDVIYLGEAGVEIIEVD